MNRFFKRDREFDLEAQLRRDRPQPTAEFMQALSKRIASDSPLGRRQKARLVTVGVALAAIVAAFGAFGGIGYAANAAKAVAVATKAALVAPVETKKQATSPNPTTPASAQSLSNSATSGSVNAADDEYGHKVTLCHKPNGPHPQTLTVSSNAVAAHLAHGDYLGPCH